MKTQTFRIALPLALAIGGAAFAGDPAADLLAGDDLAFRIDPRVSELDLGFDPGRDDQLLAFAGQLSGGGDDAPAGAVTPYGAPRLGAFSVHGGMGLTASPTTFQFALGAEYFVTSNLSVGPLMQFGFEEHWSIIAPSINVRWTFDLDIESPWNRLTPFAEMGMGACYIHHDRPGDNEEWGFLINFGGGIDYYLTDDLSIGTEMLFNFLPGEVQGEHYFFSWQVVTLRFLF